ncbi:oxygenase MpaB family protein [Streptomyces sp. 4F14]|uniref:oxygenase MpaB family protein n=1 Tax=Streptomyces sp. 4F14 TaxID=3394380 RepID=UPI003A892705
MQLAAALCLSGVPGSYASPHAARVMTQTQRLRQPARRTAETFQFILYLMAEEPLAPSGRLIRACRKVRLVHATVRKHGRPRRHLGPVAPDARHSRGRVTKGKA